MRIESSAIHRCPHSGGILTAIPESTGGGEIVSLELKAPGRQGCSYAIRDSTPYFADLAAEPLTDSERRDLAYYR